MTVAIVDYGMGNLGSVYRAVEECGGTPLITCDPEAIVKADHLILPGVGAFAEGMKHLTERGLVEPLKTAALQSGTPLLGICLGMQLLASYGEEGGGSNGLDLIAGEVVRLKPDAPETRIPHIGWNEVVWKSEIPINKQFTEVHDFYFVHSYHFIARNVEHVAAVTPYCGEFSSAVFCENIFGVQFHPEKSSKNGLQILRNFLALTRNVNKKTVC